MNFYLRLDCIYKIKSYICIYKNAKNPEHQKVKYRIELYTKIIEHAKMEK